MAADYYIRKSSDEREDYERWENEGGRLRQNLPRLERRAGGDEGVEL